MPLAVSLIPDDRTCWSRAESRAHEGPDAEVGPKTPTHQFPALRPLLRLRPRCHREQPLCLLAAGKALLLDRQQAGAKLQSYGQAKNVEPIVRLSGHRPQRGVMWRGGVARATGGSAALPAARAGRQGWDG